MADDEEWNEIDASNEMAADMFEEDGGDEEILKMVQAKKSKKSDQDTGTDALKKEVGFQTLKIPQSPTDEEISFGISELTVDIGETQTKQEESPTDQEEMPDALQLENAQDDEELAAPNSDVPENPDPEEVPPQLEDNDNFWALLAHPIPPSNEQNAIEFYDDDPVVPKFNRQVINKWHTLSPENDIGIPYIEFKTGDEDPDKKKAKLEPLEPLPVSSKMRELSKLLDSKELPNDSELEELRIAFDKLSNQQQKVYINQWRDRYPAFSEWRKVEPNEDDAASIDSMILTVKDEPDQDDSTVISGYFEGKEKQIQQRKEKELESQNAKDMAKERINKQLKYRERDNKLELELKSIDEVITHQELALNESVTQSADPIILNNDEFGMIFSGFTFQGLFLLSKVCPQWEEIIIRKFKKQKYLWFLNDESKNRRLLPIDDCCRQCDSHIIFEPMIRIKKNWLNIVTTDILVFTPNLKCLRLQRFALNHTKLVKNLANQCPHLIHLDLTECYDVNFIVIELLVHKYPKMIHLIMKSTNLDEDMLGCVFRGMTALETLVVSSTYLTGESLRFMPKSLKRLDIRCCPHLSHALVANAFRVSRNRGLTHIKIDAIDNIVLFEDLVEQYKSSLVVLVLNEIIPLMKMWTPREWEREGPPFNLHDLQQLQSLTIGQNVEIDSGCLKKLMEKLTQLRSFSLECNTTRAERLATHFRREPYFTTEALSEMPVHWSRLERLELLGCPQVNRQFMPALTKMKNLQYLDLSYCTKLTDDAFPQVLMALNKLTFVVIDRCPDLSKGTLDAVIKKAHRMTNQTLTVSMLRCNFKSIPRLKAKLLPKNLRLSLNSNSSKIYWTFDGIRLNKGRMNTILEYLSYN